MTRTTVSRQTVRTREAGVPVLVTSRMSSQRLPGKALKVLAGKPLIQWVLEAVKFCEETSAVFVATSNDSSDQSLRDWCRTESVEWIEGPLHDTLRRLADAATALRSESIVRISGDSPLLDPRLIDHALRLFSAGNYDLVTNVQVRTFPKGQSVEVIRTEFLHKLVSHQLPGMHREHVTSAVYQGLVPARVRNFTSEEQSPEYCQAVSRRGIDLAQQNLSVDTLEDATHVEAIISLIHPVAPAQAGWIRCIEAHLQGTTDEI